MLSWQWPWMFALIPLPFILRMIVPERKQEPDAIRVPFYHDLYALNQKNQRSAAPRWLQALFMLLIWCCLVTAAARPSWIGDPVPLPQEGRDLMMAVDISQSMQEQDMQVRSGYATRITAVKAVVGDFIENRVGDRIGLILFGQQGYLQTPLTFDTQTVKQQLDEAQLGFAGNATAIGDAIGLAIKTLRDRPAESRVLILLTDGANTAGTDPNEAMKIADEANIRIHTVGIGAPRRGRPSADNDERLLSDIATRTGGEYFRARDPNELQTIYAQLDRLEPMPEEQTFRPSISLTYWPLGFALVLSAVIAITRIVRTGSIFTFKADASEAKS